MATSGSFHVNAPLNFGSISKKSYGDFLATVMPFFVYSLRWGATVMPTPKETKK